MDPLERSPSIDRVPPPLHHKERISFVPERLKRGERSSSAFDYVAEDHKLYDSDQRYKRIAEDKNLMDYFIHNENNEKMGPIKRSPYKTGVLMCRGAAYYPRFKDYIERGGLAKYKNSVVASVRINALHNFDEMNGSFSVSYFLDLAFWVPEYMAEEYNNPNTVGKHIRYEPVIRFPDTISSKIINRTHAFSKDEISRNHEIQLGQNMETLTTVKSGTWLELTKRYEPGLKTIIRGNFPKAHWPRLWRVLCSDEEVKTLQSSQLSQMIHSHSNSIHSIEFAQKMRAQLADLDNFREKLLSHPKEGIMFVTHEIEATCLEHFDLVEFPYDTQAMSIKIRVEKAAGDPLNRFLVPLCTDKAFFCTSRVAPLVEWMIAKNLHWEVTAGAGGDISRDGGKQRLIVRVLVCRKSYYYTLHYIIMAFSISTISFTAFSIDAMNVTARVNVVLTILLTVVAFNYVCQDKIPKVSYSTILDKFLICNHIAILLVGLLVILVSYMRQNKSKISNGYFFGIRPKHEGVIGSIMFCIWIFGNAYFGGNTMINVKTVRYNIEVSQQLEFLDFTKNNESSREFIEELQKDGPFIIEPLRKCTNNFINFIMKYLEIQQYFKLKKKQNRNQRKKMMKKFDQRGFEVCGSDVYGDFFYNLINEIKSTELKNNNVTIGEETDDGNLQSSSSSSNHNINEESKFSLLTEQTSITEQTTGSSGSSSHGDNTTLIPSISSSMNKKVLNVNSLSTSKPVPLVPPPPSPPINQASLNDKLKGKGTTIARTSKKIILN